MSAPREQSEATLAAVLDRSEGGAHLTLAERIEFAKVQALLALVDVLGRDTSVESPATCSAGTRPDRKEPS